MINTNYSTKPYCTSFTSGYHNIVIINKQNPLFCQEVKEALDTLNSKETGQTLLTLLLGRASPIYILEGDENSCSSKIGVISLQFCSQHSIDREEHNLPERATHLAPINLPQEWREEIKRQSQLTL